MYYNVRLNNFKNNSYWEFSDFFAGDLIWDIYGESACLLALKPSHFYLVSRLISLTRPPSSPKAHSLL